jgi:uncharacterized protein YndB with AHSA1/START domain
MTHLVRSKEIRVPPSAAAPLAGVNSRFAVRARKTIAASAAGTFAAWTDSRRRACWLIGVNLTIRASTAPKFIRLTCDDDDTEIVVRITTKGSAHTVVAVDHTQLASAHLVAERRHCWKEMLRNLKHYLEAQG